ncbi:MAG: hypothetical protein UR95_C0005G0062 [Parcubacteria group bacterium GW2011_GWC1_36_108]|nr:MAG: hypothetical protein UR95_C0005G0062 [Parcubacteria group bacterium GW2011_GWC1_36_108]
MLQSLKIKIVCFVDKASKEVIIKNKLISITKSVLSGRNVALFVAICSLFLLTPDAQASESPVQSLLRFSKEKITKVRKVTIENPAANAEVETKKEDKNEKKLIQLISTNSAVPKVVTDPAEIEKAAEFAAEATGVRKNFIIGLLVVESDLGRNHGECTYQEVEEGAKANHQNGYLSTRAWKTFQERREIIKDVAGSLGYDYKKLNVSCNPGSYAGTGGAMGIPQFMPDTWMEYKDRISAVVGKENPDPWNEKDAAVAVALKLSDVYGVTDHNRLAEKRAAKLYLSGTTSYQYDWYANQILYWAENYKSLIG